MDWLDRRLTLTETLDCIFATVRHLQVLKAGGPSLTRIEKLELMRRYPTSLLFQNAPAERIISYLELEVRLQMDEPLAKEVRRFTHLIRRSLEELRLRQSIDLTTARSHRHQVTGIHKVS